MGGSLRRGSDSRTAGAAGGGSDPDGGTFAISRSGGVTPHPVFDVMAVASVCRTLASLDFGPPVKGELDQSEYELGAFLDSTRRRAVRLGPQHRADLDQVRMRRPWCCDRQGPRG
ncbi:hypothetical protein [Streptomyces sp. NPDC051014]|uniref:hypothetical protein n=1 Tax=Streptomyces sp. NPDC051014 TaxID=3155751 RepID=UPI0033EEE361